MTFTPPTWSRRPWPPASPRLLAALLLCAGSACYSPTIRDGGFRCNTTLGASACPDGYKCDPGTNRCWRQGPVDARDAAGDAAGDGAATDRGGTEVATDSGGGTDAACFAPKAGCTPQGSGRCDPACQSGCGCREKCSVNTAGGLTCNAPSGTGRRQLLETCDITSAGASAQTDNCAPGLVCLEDGCNGRCYQFCHGDADCPGSTCSRDAGGGVKVCDVPEVDCDPVGTGSGTTCGTTQQACYLSPNVKDRTVCDCPLGGVGENGACTLSRECLPRLACVNGHCRRVCNLNGTGGVLCLGGSCTALNGSSMYGYCN